jgi:hypothetical protein
MKSSEQRGTSLLSRREKAAVDPAPGWDESGPPADGAQGLGLGLFMRQLAEIAPDKPIRPESDLIDDLGFGALAFGRLAVMLYERYGIDGISAAFMRSQESRTVEGFFRCCILDLTT